MAGPVLVVDGGPGGLSPPEWTRPDAPERLARLAVEAVARAGPEADRWVTVSRLNVRAVRAGLVEGAASGRRGDIASTLRTVDHMLAGHVLAYEVVRDRLLGARVAVGLEPVGLYELDGLLVDLLLARSSGVGRHELDGWLEPRRAAYGAAVPAPGGPCGPVLRAWVAAAVAGPRAYPRAVTAVYASPHQRPVDAVATTGPGRPGPAGGPTGPTGFLGAKWSPWRPLGTQEAPRELPAGLERWTVGPATSVPAAGPSWPGTRPGR